MIQAYDTLSQAIDGLRKKGYSLDFNIAFDQIKCHQNDICLNPSQFEITETYRFEGDSDPADEAILLAIESKEGGMKGLLVSGYGANSVSVSEDLLRKLSLHRN